MDLKRCVSGLVALLGLVLLPARPIAASPLHQSRTPRMLVISKVMLLPKEGGSQWVELYNRGSSAADIGGYLLRGGEANAYRLPGNLPRLSPGGVVTVYYDGRGPTADRRTVDAGGLLLGAELHTPAGLMSPFDAAVGQLALVKGGMTLYVPLVLDGYQQVLGLPTFELHARLRPISVVAFVAWGADPGPAARQAVADGAWIDHSWAPTDDAPGQIALEQGSTIGLYRGGPPESAAGWLAYGANQASPGVANPVPAPWPLSPPDGIVATAAGLYLAWTPSAGETQYHVQISDGPLGLTPEPIGVQDTRYPVSLAPGSYYWRVAAGSTGLQTPWSPTRRVIVKEAVQPEPALAAGESMVLGLTPRLQHKDTRMLCLDGDPEVGVGRWDAPHGVGGTPMVVNAHDAAYSTNAAIAMVVEYYGGALSQDRIAYHYHGGGGPEGDMGHGRGMWPNGHPTTGAGPRVLEWALGTTAVLESGRPGFDSIREWIDADRPIVAVEWVGSGHHSTVIDGYWVTQGGAQMVRRLDPATAQANWVLWDTWEGVQWCYVPPSPGEGVSARSDEDEDANGIPDTIADSDGDGVCDFDERYRFPLLDWQNPDSDGDGVPDKADMRGYLFTTMGRYAPRPADTDGDGRRKEADPDNDHPLDAGAMDGCEDGNRDGYQNVGETSNFDPTDDLGCNKPVVRITYPTEGLTIAGSADECCVRLQGTITSDSPIVALYARQVTWESAPDARIVPLVWGPAPSYEFDETLCFGAGPSSILVRATNRTDAGIDVVNVTCPAR